MFVRTLNKNAYKNVCPRNCPSSCTMISYANNNKIKHIEGNITNPYTNGKLCAKGFSYIEQNHHEDRLKYPYYQKIKGSGSFTRISWEKAFELINNNLRKIYDEYNSLFPFALYKGTGNIGILQNVIDEFFASINNTTIINGATHSLNKAIKNLSKQNYNDDYKVITDCSLIIIWGANPAVSNIHLIPLIIDAKMKDAKVVVIDPIYTQTAELADLYIQVKPNSDRLFSYVLIKLLVESGYFNPFTIEEKLDDFVNFFENLLTINIEDFLEYCNVNLDILNELIALFQTSKKVAFVLGTGLLKHANSSDNLQSIKLLLLLEEITKQEKSNVLFKKGKLSLFSNERVYCKKDNLRFINTNELNFHNKNNKTIPIEMLWISCGNPLNQELNSRSFKSFMDNVPFVVTVDRFMTETAKMSNLILPTTSHFEQSDIVISNFHNKIAFNEQAAEPYFESKSDWEIITHLAKSIKKDGKIPCSFTIYDNEEQYLNAQFNSHVEDVYNVKDVAQLKKYNHIPYKNPKSNDDHQGSNKSNISFPSKNELNKQLNLIKTFGPSKQYPFWLITAHHPYMLNSQFHYLNLTDEQEVCVYLNSKKGAELNINNGEVVSIFNEQSAFNIKATYNNSLPKDILLIYQGWHMESGIVLNELISEWQNIYDDPHSTNHLYAFFDTFVNIKKIY